MNSLLVGLFVCYTSYAVNRRSVALSLPAMLAEGLEPSHAGLIASSQNVAFAASKFAAGVLSDRLQPELLFAAGLLLSGAAAAAFACCALSAAPLCALWFVNGLAQGCGWPAIAKILRKRVPASRFGTLWSLMSSSINVAGSLSPLAAAFLVARLGWRWNVFLAGLLSIFLGFLFLLLRPLLSKTPESQSDKAQKAEPAGSCTWALFCWPFMWLLSASFAVVFFARTTAVDWGQLYLIKDRGHSQLTASAFTSSFELGGLVGRITAGYVSDWLVRNTSTSRKGSSRLSVGLLFLVGGWLAAHSLRFHVSDRSSPACVMGVGAALGLCLYGVIAVVGIVAAESVPPTLSGVSNAVVSLFGNLGSVLSGLPLSCLAGHYGWSSVFLLLEILLAGNCLLLLCCRNARPGKWHQS